VTEPTRRRLRLPNVRLGLLPWALAVIVLLVAGGLYARALSTPVQRAGHPTSTVAPLPLPTPVVASTTPPTPSTVSPSGSSTASPSPTMSTSPTSSTSPKSSGKFATAGVSIAAVGATGTLHRYSVRVETSLGAKVDTVATQIAGVLNDPRSWAGSGDVRFALVADPKKAEFAVTLASSTTAAKTCKPAAGSCWKGASLVLDASVWTAPAATFAGVDAWQSYLVNHAVGLVLGEASERCPKKGKPAPVMLDQSGDLGGCVANPWPNP
jgi:Protein of unknown function (DUF3152).